MERTAEVNAEALLAQAGWLRGLARALVNDPEEVEDLVQETWHRLLKHPPRSEGAGLRSWMARVMRNLALTRRRDESLRAWHERAARSELWSEGETEERIALQRTLAETVHALYEPYRSAIVLRYFEGLSLRQVADRQGISYDASRQRISRGLASLREALDRDLSRDRASWCAMLACALDRPAVFTGWFPIGELIVSLKLKTLCAASGLIALTLAIAWYSAGGAGRPVEDPAITPAADLEPTVDSEGEPFLGRSAQPSTEPTPGQRPAVAFDPDRDLHGEVLDTTGRPLPQALVEVFRNESSEFSFLDTERGYQRSKVIDALTDTEGRFAVRLELGRPYLVEVTAMGLARERIGNRYAGEHVVIRMHRGSRLEGRVSSGVDQSPVPGVSIRPFLDSVGTGPKARIDLESVTDSGGRFQFETLSPGPYVVRVLPPSGLSGLRRKVELSDGQISVLDIVLPAGATLRGRVTDGVTGQPIPDAEVGESWTLQRTVRTNRSGEYEYPGFPLEGIFDLSARASGYGRKEKKVRGGTSDPFPERIDFELLPGRTARGRVLDDQGRPVSNAYIAGVTYQYQSAMDWISATTAENGTFLLNDLRPDASHTLLAKKEGLGMVVLDFPDSESTEALLDFGDIVLPQPSLLRGVVVDEDGRHVPDQEVYLRGSNSDRGRLRTPSSDRSDPEERLVDAYVGTRRARTDHLGRFAFGDLSAGSYRVESGWKGGITSTMEHVEVPGSKVIDGLRLILEGSLSISGQVLDAAGNPVPEAFVRAESEGNPARPGMDSKADREGRFLLRGLVSGTYRVRAETQHWREEKESLPGPAMAPAQMTGIPAGQRDLEIRLPRTRAVLGLVLDHEGKPSPASTIQGTVVGSGLKLTARTDASGRFELLVGEGDIVDLTAHRSPRDGAHLGEARASGVVPGTQEVTLRLPGPR